MGRALVRVFSIAFFAWIVRAVALYLHIVYVEGSLSPTYSLLASNELLRVGSDLSFISLGAFLGASTLEEWHNYSKPSLIGCFVLMLFLSGTAYFLFLIVTNKAISLVFSSFAYGSAFGCSVLFGAAAAFTAVHLTSANKPIAG